MADEGKKNEKVSPGHSVLQHLSGRTGGVSRVFLSEPGSDGASPIVQPKSVHIPGGRLGRYQLLGEIARGGIGVILKGQDTDLGREVAMKVLREEYEERDDVIQRFVEEAQIAGQLQHPGIIPVYELGVTKEKKPFIAMKLVKGRTLAAALEEQRSGRTTMVARLLPIFEAICHTMSYAHSRRVVHRDLKPANVMIGAFGEVLVVDWGLAKVLARGKTAPTSEEALIPGRMESIVATLRSGSTAGQSLAGSVIGTPRYMPPEQARGDVENLDERADVFALGAILTEILTGQPPYVGDDREALLDAARGKQEGARERLGESGADAELVEIALSCMAPAADARPAHAGVVAAEISEYLASVEKRAREAKLDAAEARRRAAEEHAKSERLRKDIERAREETARDRAIAAERRAEAARFQSRAERAQGRAEKEREQAEGERRLRRTLMMIGGVAAVLLLAAGLTYHFVTDGRHHRIETATRDVSSAVEEASRLRGSAEDEAGFRAAVSAAERARKLGALPDVVPSVQERAEALLASIQEDWESFREEEERRAVERVLVARIQEIRFNYVDDQDPEAAEKAFAEAFTSIGLGPDVEPAVAAFRIQKLEDPVGVALGLDLWVDAREEARQSARALREMSAAADPDEIRNRIRSARDALGVSKALEGLDREKLAVPTVILATRRLMRGGFTENAFALLRHAWQLHPSDLGILFEAGVAAAESGPGRMADAARFFAAALAKRPDCASLWSLLANEYLRDGDVVPAIRLAERARSMGPNRFTPYRTIGLARELMGHLPAAKTAVEAWAERRPDDALAHVALLRIHLESGDFEAARAAGENALRIGGGDLAIARLARPLLDECEQMVAFGGQGDAEDRPGPLVEAAFHRRSGRPLDAVRAYREAFSREEDRATRDPALAFSAAKAAARAAQVETLDETERAAYRKQAADWLRSVLDEWVVRANRGEREPVCDLVSAWESERDLSTILSPPAIEKLPDREAESYRWLRLAVKTRVARQHRFD